MQTDKKQFVFHLCSSVFICGSILLSSFFICGCDRKPAQEVVLYTSIDQPIAAPIVREFEQKTGIKVTLVTDTEATKSVGLAERLRAEKANPQADVWWSNEIFHTINLADEGVLVVGGTPEQPDVAKNLCDPQHRWAVNGMRLRVIAKHVDGPQHVTHLEQLADPTLKGRIAMARPTAGTTGGFVASLYTKWGDQKADTFFRALHANDIKLLGGNSVVAELVGRGQVDLGLTDNDDCDAARGEGGKLEVILPDQDAGGTLVVPTSIGMVSGRRTDRAIVEQLIAFLVSREVEQKLIGAKFAYGSVREGIGQSVKTMDVDYHAVARKMPEAVRRATAILEGRE